MAKLTEQQKAELSEKLKPKLKDLYKAFSPYDKQLEASMKTFSESINPIVNNLLSWYRTTFAATQQQLAEAINKLAAQLKALQIADELELTARQFVFKRIAYRCRIDGRSYEKFKNISKATFRAKSTIKKDLQYLKRLGLIYSQVDTIEIGKYNAFKITRWVRRLTPLGEKVYQILTDRYLLAKAEAEANSIPPDIEGITDRFINEIFGKVPAAEPVKVIEPIETEPAQPFKPDFAKMHDEIEKGATRKLNKP